MTSDSGRIEISRDEFESLADKVQTWSSTLSDQEQLVLSWLLARATAAASGEVSGYLATQPGGVPFSTQLGQAAGLAPDTRSIIIEMKPMDAGGGSFGRPTLR